MKKEHGSLTITLNMRNQVRIGENIVIEIPDLDRRGMEYPRGYQSRVRIFAPKDVAINREPRGQDYEQPIRRNNDPVNQSTKSTTPSGLPIRIRRNK